MQTFLPFPDFGLSLCCLDDARLARQRIDALAIYHILKENKTSQMHHPAVKMWKGYGRALGWYCNLSLSHLRYRNGGTHPSPDYINLGFPVIFPPWLGNHDFHRSHQSNLLRKDEVHYRLWFGTTVPKNLEYVWPVK
jgi:hypothetical protein